MKKIITLFLIVMAGPTFLWAQCTPVSAKICLSGDDTSTVYLNGNLVGTAGYCGGDGTGSCPPACLAVPVGDFSLGTTIFLAVQTQNTAAPNFYSSWDLDVTCSGGGHSEVTNSDGGVQLYYDFPSPPTPPANDGGGNAWTSPSYSGTSFAMSGTTVTAATLAQPISNPLTGAALPFISIDSTGSYGATSGALFWRQIAVLPAPSPLPSVTNTPTPTNTFFNPSVTYTITPTPTITPTNTPTNTITQTIFPTFTTATKTPTQTPTNTLFTTITITPFSTVTGTPTNTMTNSATNSPTQTPTWTPTFILPTTPTWTDTITDTPTTSPTPSGPITLVYVNGSAACSGALGCSITIVNACRQLNLDSATSFMIMRICVLCGVCQPSDIMTLRLTMGWDEICAHYGIDWSTFVVDLQARIATLLPEIDTPNQILRGASNDPSIFIISNPVSMPDTITTGTTSLEACPLCQ